MDAALVEVAAIPDHSCGPGLAALKFQLTDFLRYRELDGLQMAKVDQPPKAPTPQEALAQEAKQVADAERALFERETEQQEEAALKARKLELDEQSRWVRGIVAPLLQPLEDQISDLTDQVRELEIRAASR